MANKFNIRRFATPPFFLSLVISFESSGVLNRLHSNRP